jgi:hypothetical protein
MYTFVYVQQEGNNQDSAATYLDMGEDGVSPLPTRYVYVYVYMYIFIYIHIYTYMSIWSFVCIRIHAFMYD